MRKSNITKDEKIRKSNFELMRIVSMFFIVLYHVLLHGKLFENTTGTVQLIVTLIESIILVQVNGFILITGYFQCKGNVKVSKIISIINETWFYKVIIMVIAIMMGLVAVPGNVEIMHTLFPIDYGTYWYINCYLLLYLISPILNKVINNSNKKELKNIIILLFSIVSILSTISRDIFFNTVTGRSLSTFILLYFIGAYMRLYPVEDISIIKKYSQKARRIIYLMGFILMVITSLLCWQMYNHMSKLNPIISDFGVIFGMLHTSYASPIVIIQTIFFFLYFSTLDFKSKIINKISACTLGIYLISENYYIRNSIYDKIGLTKVSNITIKIIGIVILIAIIFFILCLIIELIRKFIFKFIYNLKLSTKIRDKIKKYFNDIGMNVNW